MLSSEDSNLCTCTVLPGVLTFDKLCYLQKIHCTPKPISNDLLSNSFGYWVCVIQKAKSISLRKSIKIHLNEFYAHSMY